MTREIGISFIGSFGIKLAFSNNEPTTTTRKDRRSSPLRGRCERKRCSGGAPGRRTDRFPGLWHPSESEILAMTSVSLHFLKKWNNMLASTDESSSKQVSILLPAIIISLTSCGSDWQYIRHLVLSEDWRLPGSRSQTPQSLLPDC